MRRGCPPGVRCPYPWGPCFRPTREAEGRTAVNYVGMDVHVRNSYLCVAGAAGQVLKRGRVGNTLAEVSGFLGEFEGEPMRVVMESTTNSRAMHRLLGDYAARAGADLRA